MMKMRMRRRQLVIRASAAAMTCGLASPLAAPAQSVDSSGVAGAEASEAKLIDEIVVTAQKREERLIDVPQSVSVLSMEDLTRFGATQFRDFADTVPGLSFSTAGPGLTQISLRGVTVGFDIGATTAIYVDEVPYGSSTAFALRAQFGLDAALFDLDRIEVLRGPQGTLYGASAMGGLLRYVTRPPEASISTTDVRGELSSTQHGGASYNGSFVVNQPIVTDKAAIRASAFYSHDGGYIDDVARGRKDVNRSNVYGGRLDLLLTPTDVLDIRLTAFLQTTARDGEGTADYTFAGAKPYGDLSQHRVTAESFDQRMQFLSGTVTYDLGAATLTSISSYQTGPSEFTADISAVYVPLLATALGRTYSAVSLPTESTTHKFTQEVRLASASGEQTEWLLGGFYTHEKSRLYEEFVMFDSAGARVLNDLFIYDNPSSYDEYAAFGNLTYHLSERFDVTGGLRYAHNEQKSEQTGSGLLVQPRPVSEASDDVITYLANARYRVSDRATAYLRYATGYRPGGPNLGTIDAATGLPVGQAAFEEDRLKSYEVGFKAETADRRFGVDLAAYYIDWSNIQLSVIRGGFGSIANAPGGAEIRGSELALTARPTSAFALGAALAYQDARLSEADADLGGADGERLPNTPRFTASVNADYELPWGNFQPTVGATVRHVSDRTASFDGSTGYPQYELPEYVTADVRAGMTLGSVTTQLYVRNVFDERGQLSVFFPQFGARVALVQPRTFGISVATHF